MSPKDIVYHVSRYLILLTLLALVLVPILYIISVSFRAPAEFFGEPHFIPKQPTLKAWEMAFNELRGPLINSTYIAVGTTIISLFIIIPGAYVFGRTEFPGKELAFYVILAAMLFPYILLIIPLTDLWYFMGIHNTIPGLWIAYQTFIVPFGIWILRDFFEKLPQNLEEAAQIYGCSKWSAFIRVVLPISFPAIAAVGFLSFFVAWNDFLFSSMLTTGQDVRPAVVSLYMILEGSERTYWAWTMAEALIIGAPPTVVYLFSRRYLAQAFEVS